MIVLVSGATATVRENPHVGVLVIPGARNAPDSVLGGRVWAMDNGAFSGLNVSMFLQMLKRYQPYQTHHTYQGCRFVTSPDVVANATETLALFKTWEPVIHAWGWPVAFVAQDGSSAATIPWASCEAIFIGGSTEFKLGREARDIGAYAKARGKWLHMGRVNSRKRLRYADMIGCDSVDGTTFSRWANVYIPKIEGWLAVPPLFQ